MCLIVDSIAILSGLLLGLVTELGGSLFDEGELDTLTLRKRDGRGLAITNNEDVGKSSGELVVVGIDNVGSVEGTRMLLDRLEDTNSTNIVTTNEHDSGTVGELDDGGDLTSGKVELDGVVQGDVGVRISHGSTVVGRDVRDLLLVDGLSDNLAELELGLLLVDLVSLESTFDIKEDSEVLVSSLNGDDVHVTKRESGVSSELTVDLDETFLVLDNLSGLLSVEGVAESLLEENIQGDALSKLVRTGGRSGTVDTLKLTKIPLLGSGNSLHGFSLSFVSLKKFSMRVL